VHHAPPTVVNWSALDPAGRAEAIARASAAPDRTVFVVHAGDDEARRVIANAGVLRHLVARPADPTDEPLAQDRVTLDPASVDVRRWVSGLPIDLLVPPGSEAPSAALAELGASLAPRLVRAADAALDELLTNARRAGPPVPIEVRLACDGGRLGVEVTDPHGALTLAGLAGFFAHLGSGDPWEIKMGSGGAGLGLAMVFTSMNHLLIAVRPGSSTRVLALLDVAGGVRRATRAGRSFNLFLEEVP